MTASAPSQPETLSRAIRALGGTWDTQRAVTALRDRGHVFADQRAAEKRARQILRDLADLGLIVKTDPDRAVYRTAEQ